MRTNQKLAKAMRSGKAVERVELGLQSRGPGGVVEQCVDQQQMPRYGLTDQIPCLDSTD